MGWFRREVKETDEVNEAKDTNEGKDNDFENDFMSRYRVDNSDNHIEKNAMAQMNKKEVEKKTDADDDMDTDISRHDRELGDDGER